MVISSLGPWALGIIMNTLGGASIWYRISIYFYLHFQYNGWFIVALFGIYFYILEQHNIVISKKLFNKFYWLLLVSVVLTFSLSVLWTKPHNSFYILSSIGAFLQFVSFWYFIKLIRSTKIGLIFSKQLLNLLILSCFLFMIKIIFQFIGSFQIIADDIAINLDVVIGYLHWTFLGVVSIPLFIFLYYFKLIRLPKKVMALYIIGFFLTEVLIFYKGYIQWKKESLSENFDLYLAIASFFLLISIVLIFWAQLKISLFKIKKPSKIT